MQKLLIFLIIALRNLSMTNAKITKFLDYHHTVEN